MRTGTREDRDYRLFVTGVISGVLLSALASLVVLPWWLALPLTLYGLWVIFDVGRGWIREWRRRDG